MNFILRFVFIAWVTNASFNALAGSQELRIVTEQWPPYNFLDEDGVLQGLATDRVRKIIAKTNLQAKIEVLSWSRALDLAKHRPNTLIFSIIRSPEREAMFDWFCPVTEPIKVSLYKLRDRKGINLLELKDAKKYTIGALRNDYGQKFLISQGFIEGKNLHTSSSDLASLRMLMQQRIDLVVNEEASMQFEMQQLGLPIEKVEMALPSIDGKTLTTCMALSKGSDKSIKDALERAMLTINP